MRHILTNNKAFTLIEILVGLGLVSLVFLTFISIDMFTRYQLVAVDRKAKMQNAISVVMEHMSKNLLLAIGNPLTDLSPIQAEFESGSHLKWIKIRVDSNANGMADIADKWIAYEYKTDSESIVYFSNVPEYGSPTGDSQVLAKRIKSFEVSDGILPSGRLVNSFITFFISSRWFTESPIDHQNPEINMINSISMPAVSIS